MPYSTASAIGRNWRHWRVTRVSPRNSGATCSSVLRRARSRLRLCGLLLKARTAQHRPALGRLKRDGRLRAALRAVRTRLGASTLRSPGAPCLALLAVLGIVYELFVVEEDLLARCENKLGAAVNALEDSISEFHGRLPTGSRPEIGHGSKQTCRFRCPVLVRVAPQGSGPREKIERYQDPCPVKPGNLKRLTPIACGVISRLSSFLGVAASIRLVSALGTSQSDAANGIGRNWRSATVTCAAAPAVPNLFEAFRGLRYRATKATGTELLAAGYRINPALCEPSYGSACAPRLP